MVCSASDIILTFEVVDYIQVGEVIPLSDASVDAVVGTLVLCSVKDVDMTLKGSPICMLLFLFAYLFMFASLKFIETCITGEEQLLNSKLSIVVSSFNLGLHLGFSTFFLYYSASAAAVFFSCHP